MRLAARVLPRQEGNPTDLKSIAPRTKADAGNALTESLAARIKIGNSIFAAAERVVEEDHLARHDFEGGY